MTSATTQTRSTSSSARSIVWRMNAPSFPAGWARLRRIQTGFVRNYALGVAAGTVALFAFVVLRTAR